MLLIVLTGNSKIRFPFFFIDPYLKHYLWKVLLYDKSNDKARVSQEISSKVVITNPDFPFEEFTETLLW